MNSSEDNEGVGVSNNSQEEDEIDVKELEEKVGQVNQSLLSCQTVTDEMLKILSSFEERLSNLEVTMLPIHKQTQTMSNAQKNIAKSIDAINEVKQHFREAESNDEYTEEKFRLDPDAFIARCLRLSEAKKFFSLHSNLENSVKLKKALTGKLLLALSECERAFRRKLEAESSVVEFTDVRWPLPQDFELISSRGISSLCSIASGMFSCGETSFSQVYSSVRSHILKTSTCSVIVATSNNSLAISEASNAASSRIADKVKIALNRKKLQATQHYEKDSHPFIALLRFFLWLVQSERNLCHTILKAGGLNTSERHCVFNTLARDSIVQIRRQADIMMKKKSDPSKCLYLLDILSVIESLSPQFSQLIAKDMESEFDLLVSMSTDIAASIRKSLVQKKEEMERQCSKQVPVDGGYDALTVQTINFLKRLCDYHEVIDSSFGDNTTRVFVCEFLNCLAATLEHKSSSIKNICLLHLYLVNNFHYIIKSVTSPNIADKCQEDIRELFQHKLKEARNAYKNCSWGKCLDYIVERDDSGDKISTNNENLTPAMKKSIKAKFTGFNAVFESLYSTQKHFSVPNADLRSQLRNENVELIVPVYHEFLAKFSMLAFSTHPGKYIKYHDNVLEQMINKFFDEES